MTQKEFDQLQVLVEQNQPIVAKLKQARSKEEFFTIVEAFGREKGLKLSAPEILEFKQKKSAEAKNSKELSDAELEAVAGGCNCWGTDPGLSSW